MSDRERVIEREGENERKLKYFNRQEVVLQLTQNCDLYTCLRPRCENKQTKVTHVVSWTYSQ